nr:hypothetical protein [Methylomarinum sp. Ch1-1]MDP4519460.1 hypothetical protein [Methylomarinum sp. Ch1-1]
MKHHRQKLKYKAKITPFDIHALALKIQNNQHSHGGPREREMSGLIRHPLLFWQK